MRRVFGTARPLPRSTRAWAPSPVGEARRATRVALLVGLAVAVLWNPLPFAPIAHVLPGIATGEAGSAHPTTGATPFLAPTHMTFPIRLDVSTERPRSAGASSVTLLPGRFRAIYGVDALLNASGGSSALPVNATIGVLAWGDGYNPADLQTFFSTYYPSSFPRPHVIPVPIDGAPPPGVNAGADPSGGSRELTIDIEWAASMAPGATIYAIYAPPGPSPTWNPTGTSLVDALGYAVGLSNLTALSLSFGEPQGSDPAVESTMDQQFQSLQRNGTTVLAASGDDGGSPSNGGGGTCTQGPGVNFPAASPYVVAVGGTDASGTGPEVAWPLSGGGAASSTANDPAPAWQEVGGVASYVAQTTGHTRQVPDVSATARDNAYFFDGTLATADGTSFSSPLWAGILSDIVSRHGTRLGQVDPSLYAFGALQEAGALTSPTYSDITSGGNCFDRSAPGWDRVTGWGTPNALALDGALSSGTYAPLTVVLAPSEAVSAGATVSVAAGPSSSGSAALGGGQLTLSVLDPSNDSWVSRLAGTFGPSGGPWWHGNFTMPASLTGRWVNVTVVVRNGSAWGVGTGVLAPPPPPQPPGPSLLDLLLGNPLPILAAFFLVFLGFRFYSDRRRTAIRGPTPAELSGVPAAPSDDEGEPPSKTVTRPRVTTGPELKPFCWKCGSTLSGHEKACPTCGTPFAA